MFSNHAASSASTESDFDIPPERTNAVLDAAGRKKDGDKRRECITADQLKETDDLVKLMISEIEDENGRVSGLEKSSNSISFTNTCVEDDVRTTWAIDMTFRTDSFSSVSKGTSSDGTVISGKVSAKRIGGCRK